MKITYDSGASFDSGEPVMYRIGPSPAAQIVRCASGKHELSMRVDDCAYCKLDRQWQPIETAPFGEMVLLWGACWRHAFPGRRNGDNGAVFVDTCEPEARGWQAFASHWMPLPDAPKKEKEETDPKSDPLAGTRMVK